MRDATSQGGSEARLHRLIFEHCSDAIVVIDDDGRLLAANRAARALPGVDVDRLFLWTPQRDPELASFRAQLRVGGRGTAELRLREPDGAARVLALEGRAHGPAYVVFLRDVTEQKRLEEELRHLRQLEDMGHLTASVVHDFNNVLTAILCATAVLEDDVAGQERAAMLAKDIRAAAERAARLVRQVLTLLRRLPARLEPLNLGAVLDESRALLELVLGPAVELSLEIDPELAETAVERDTLEHVLLNLAANARDAMPHGGKVAVTAANVPVGDTAAGAAHCAPSGSYVSLGFTDTGEGMAPEVRERVFERFYTTKTAGKGTGLGLASAYRFARASGGCIAVRSAPGQGTAVVLYLPRVGAPRSTPARPTTSAAKQRGTETVLLVDVDDTVRGAVRAVLTESGYRVIDAPSGELAWRQAQMAIAPVDLVLADLSAPGVPGREVVARLRALGQAPRLLWMSGDADAAIAERRLSHEPLLRKAFSPVQLVARVREVLDAADAAAAAEG
ncbi:MAG TPA: ATP-binding protein [Polyangiaceae bacterium]|jgi:PAS domain S-box-containing protein